MIFFDFKSNHCFQISGGYFWAHWWHHNTWWKSCQGPTCWEKSCLTPKNDLYWCAQKCLLLWALNLSIWSFVLPELMMSDGCVCFKNWSKLNGGWFWSLLQGKCIIVFWGNDFCYYLNALAPLALWQGWMLVLQVQRSTIVLLFVSCWQIIDVVCMVSLYLVECGIWLILFVADIWFIYAFSF